jgi:ribosomal protein L9
MIILDNGIEREATASEVAEIEARKANKATLEKESHNRAIKEKIDALEVKQARSVREAILTGDKTYLSQYNDQIIALRSQIIP